MSGEQPYVAQLRRWDEDDAMLAAKQVAELQDHPGWTQLQRLLEDAHGSAFERLLAGHSGFEGRHLEQAEYVRLTAFLAGLRESAIAAQAFQTYAERVRVKNAEKVASLQAP